MTAFFAAVTDAISDPETYVDEARRRRGSPRRPSCCARWRAGRETLAKALTGAAGEKLPWFGTADVGRLDGHRPAHGDLGARRWTSPTRSASTRTPTARLRHIAHLGIRTLEYAFSRQRRAGAGRDGPGRADRAGRRDVDVRARRTRANRVTGPALDFCLLVTQRRHRADLALRADRRRRRRWLDIAQAFAGPPGPAGREPTGSATGMMLRIGNASGFYGDRFAAWREMLDGGELDVLTGDYLAELTMLILGRDRLQGPVRSATPRPSCASWRTASALALERGVRIVTNAGGLNPAGLADALRELADRLGLAVQVAHVEGDDRCAQRRTRSPPTPTSAGSASRSACGPARTSWSPAGSPTPRWSSARPSPTSAGAAPTSTRWPGPTVAGHILECGAQATGGNFTRSSPSCPTRAAGPASRSPRSPPTARRVITKHPGTGGAVTVETVTAQLLYEIGAPALPRPGRDRPA